MGDAVDCKDGLQELWKRSGIKTKEGFAKKIGLPRSTSLMRYLPGGEYRGKTLPDHIVDGLVKNITRTGSPPVTLDEILDLSGISALTSTEHSRSVVGHNAAMATGCYIPVISIGDAIMYEKEEGEARVLSPIKHSLSDRHLDGNEFSIFLPDDSMGVRFPAGSLAIVQPVNEGSPPLAPGQSAFLKITHADGREEGVVRLYSLKGYSDDTGERIEDYKALGDGFPSFKVGSGAAFPRVKLVGRVVQIKVTYDL